jgi:hypothetical protein
LRPCCLARPQSDRDLDLHRLFSHAAIVENKRLRKILAWIKEQQDRPASIEFRMETGPDLDPTDSAVPDLAE